MNESASPSVTHLTSDTFNEQLVADERPVLVDFWADWCGPCKMVAPELDRLAVEQAAALRVAKVDVDAHADLARQFGVQSIPTMILFSEGQAVARIVGAKSKDQILAEIADRL